MVDILLIFIGVLVLGFNVFISEFKINFVCFGVGEEFVLCVSVVSVIKWQVVICCDIYVVKGGDEKLVVMVFGIIVFVDVFILVVNGLIIEMEGL